MMWFFFAGWGIEGALANLVPAAPGRWPLFVALAVWCLFCATVGHWLMRRYRIRVERKEV